VAAGQDVLEQRDPLADQVGVPPAPVLLGQRDQVAALVGAGGLPRRGQQHQRQRARHLVVVGQPTMERRVSRTASAVSERSSSTASELAA